MANQEKIRQKTPLTQLTTIIPTADKTLIQQAAERSGARSLSAFIRETVLEKAQEIMQRSPANPASTPTSTAGQGERILHASIGPALPEDAPHAAAAFPTVQNFATVFSDRNRAMLRYIGSHTPRSIAALSEEIDYPYRGLHHILSTLAGYGVTGYHGSGSGGQHLTPYLQCDRIRLTLPFSANMTEDGHFLNLGIQASAGEPLPGKADKILRSMTEFSRGLPAHALELLRALANEKPDTAEQLAQLAAVSIDGLYFKLKAIKKMGLIATIGRHPIRPRLAYDGLSLDLILRA